MVICGKWRRSSKFLKIQLLPKFQILLPQLLRATRAKVDQVVVGLVPILTSKLRCDTILATVQRFFHTPWHYRARISNAHIPHIPPCHLYTQVWHYTEFCHQDKLLCLPSEKVWKFFKICSIKIQAVKILNICSNLAKIRNQTGNEKKFEKFRQITVWWQVVKKLVKFTSSN